MIGELWRTAAGFGFRYGHELSKARDKGFQLLPEFPADSAEVTFASPYLFATFAQRIPSPRRSDFGKIMRAWGVQDSDDPLEVLALSGGIQLTDRLEMAEHRDTEDDLWRPLQIRVAGMRHYDGRDHVSAGDELTLVREPENPHDEFASIILVRTGQKLGHVPRQYSQLIARHLDSGATLLAHAVRQLTFPADTGRWLVRLERATSQSAAPRRETSLPLP